jgi:small subunit ribosomal protein S20
VKTAVKQVQAALEAGDAEKARGDLREAVSLLQKTASKGVFHRNKASRKISRLARQVNQTVSS